ncbi:MAG TPA: metabolite traffic protein EboE [Vicinamibacterales bacterium]
MRLDHGLHLAYCTNIHPGESWTGTFDALERHVLAVRARVAPGEPYAIGLRLSDLASRELSDRATLTAFRTWLDRHDCYVFTINGFPFGRFHGTRVKEQVYAPDWTTDARLEYTTRLFDLLAELAPHDSGGSVSTVPVSYKAFIRDELQLAQARRQIWRAVDHIAALAERTGKDLHLGLEPEPLCVLETSAETVRFFEALRQDRPGDDRLDRHLGINYDTCHLAVEYEEASAALRRLTDAGIRVSKLHLSSALRVRPDAATREALTAFTNDRYFHQVVERSGPEPLVRYTDLDVALAAASSRPPAPDAEWRIHFHIPLHSPATALFGNTADHLRDALDVLSQRPGLCRHLEMETYTWEVMPPALKGRSVVDQLANEYAWTLAELGARGIGRASGGARLHRSPAAPERA